MGSERPRWRKWLRTLRDVWFPPVCVHCRRLVEAPGRRHLCDRCARSLHRIEGAHCPTCGYPFFGAGAEDRLCPHCEALVPEFREGRAAVLLRGPARTLVIDLKYHAALHVLEEIEMIVRETDGFLDHVRDAVLVPVPLHPRKERERGYNQSQLLAETFARAAGGATRVAAPIRRIADTRTQTRLDRHARQENLRDAFAPVSGFVVERGARHVLVDDVFTTGATLNACAGVLRHMGVALVDVATFGHG